MVIWDVLEAGDYSASLPYNYREMVSTAHCAPVQTQLTSPQGSA